MMKCKLQRRQGNVALRVGPLLLAPLTFVSLSDQAWSLENSASSRLVLAHYMPWYEAPPASAAWGWHWTMNAYDPEEAPGGRRSIASHYYPLIGPYDSGGPTSSSITCC